MKLTFRIEYRTQCGEAPGVTLQGSDSPLMLSGDDGAHWQGSLQVEPQPCGTRLAYRYAIYRDGVCRRTEESRQPHLLVATDSDRHLLCDSWRGLPRQAFLYTQAFNEEFAAPPSAEEVETAGRRIVLRALCPAHSAHRRLAVCGSCEAMGCWSRPLAMQRVQSGEYAVALPRECEGAEYKFVLCNAHTMQIEEWEADDNRRLTLPPHDSGEAVVLAEAEPHFASLLRRVAGTAIPVFSLRSEGSFGVGDFGDLKKMIDWAAATRQRALQILPINDTTINNTETDSYPYNSISIYAFHPMYVDLRQLGELKDKEAAASFEKERRELNALSQIDYVRVNEAKRAYLRAMFAQEGEELLATAEFKRFYAQNEYWLQPYAAFSCLRDLYGTAYFPAWPRCAQYHPQQIAALCAPQSELYPQIAFYYYVQYHLHVQLLSAGEQARRRGVILKGDIPIGISRCSVEAWVEPHYFNMDGQAGAPPDTFSVNGQNWGFPTYNWQVMERDGYRWWRRRFAKMAEYFTAYRIDHILGFFRIWEIPTHSVHGLLGQFSPALPMSVEEIESYGLAFDRERMTEPYIDDAAVAALFGEEAAMVKERFLLPRGDGRYRLKELCDTQRKVEALFANDGDNERTRTLRNGLYTLISDLLFVPDHKQAGLYHPRIAVQGDFVFAQLTPQEQQQFNALYEHYFYHRHNLFWYEEAMKKLPVLTGSTPMLVCGEDLGMVPQCVPWVMEQLQILSLEIESMPKIYGYEFGCLNEYPLRSVCTISTHDTATLRGEWELNKERTAHYYRNVLGREGEPPSTATGELCEEVVRRHLACPSLLCILSFQDWMSMDESLRNPDVNIERINVPSNPRNYWRYRMHLTIEELMRCDGLNGKIARLIEENGR